MNEEIVDLDFEISVTSTVICHLMRTSLQKFLDMLVFYCEFAVYFQNAF